MDFTCMHLWRWEYPTCRYYHSYQVSNWLRASVWFFSHSTVIQCKLWIDLTRLWMHWDDIGWNSSIHVWENEWGYFLPQLESSGLLGVSLNVFWRESSLPPHIIGVLTKNRAVYFFSNYYERLVFKVVNDELPPELSDLFIDGDIACLNIHSHSHNHSTINGNSNYLLVYIWSTHRLHVTTQIIPYSMNVIQLNRLLVWGRRWVFQWMVCHCSMYDSLRVTRMIYNTYWMKEGCPVSLPSYYCYQTLLSYWIGLLMEVKYAINHTHLQSSIGVRIHHSGVWYYHPYPWTRISIDQIGKSSVYKYPPRCECNHPWDH